MSTTFEMLGLQAELIRAVTELGYETPSPIQQQAIPLLLEGQDVVGQAQTGTGKTAAFALPMLQRLNPRLNAVQAILLTPTRELALQVAEAVTKYSKHMGLRVTAVYGGQSYTRQKKQLQGGVQVVVGTPGRTLDLIQQKALDLSNVVYLVLDEADEMLSMGFIDDVETIMASTPPMRQTALFSATMPDAILAIRNKYMRDPQLVSIIQKTMTVPQTEQRLYLTYDDHKLGALCRLLETEDMKSALIFARTKIGAAHLAEALLARGYPAEALHGDLNQDAREAVLRRYRSGQLTILVATDVVARGVDIQGVSHVFNYDTPYDAEDYVHRIGRTGRAGKSGIAITIATPRERRWLRQIEQFTRQRMNPSRLPSKADVLVRRDERFKEALNGLIGEDTLQTEQTFVQKLIEEGFSAEALAAAAIKLARSIDAQRPLDDVREAPLQEEQRPRREQSGPDPRRNGPRREGGREGGGRDGRQEQGMVRLLLNVGKSQGIQPGDIVGAIASEAGIPGRSIGAISIRQHETLVDVQEQHVEKVLRQMTRSTMRGQAVRLQRAEADTANSGGNERGGNWNDRPRQSAPRDGGRDGDRNGRDYGSREFGHRDNERGGREKPHRGIGLNKAAMKKQPF
jgi:ATP-dependent RNA helicase DeaD